MQKINQFIKDIYSNFINLKQHKVALLILLLLFIFLARFFVINKLIIGHDIEVHGVRLANYYLALRQGQFPPQWAPNMNYGFGYPVFIYSYQLVYFLGSVFFAVFNSVELALNAIYIIAILAAVFGSYALAYQKTENKFISFLAVLIYVLSPYYLLNLYIRGSIAELFFLSILPIVWYFIDAKYTKINSILLTIFTFLLINSHHISLLVALPILVSYLIYQHFFSLNKKDFGILTFKLLPIMIAVLMSSFYWMPSLLEANLTEVTSGGYTKIDNNFLNIKDLIWKLWDCQNHCYIWQQRPVPTFLGPSSFLIVIFTLISYSKWKNGQMLEKSSNFWLLVFCFTTFMMTPLSFLIWKNMPIIGMIEFPWLLLWVTTLSAFMIFTQIPKIFWDSESKWKNILVSVILAQSLFSLMYFAKPKGYFDKNLEDWLHFGDISQNYDGLLPKWFDSNQNLKLDKNLVIRLNDQKTYNDIGDNTPKDQGVHEIITWSGTQMKYIVEATASAEVIQKTAYFPGWHAYVNDKEVPINYQDQEFSGRIIIPIETGKSDIEVIYKGDSTVRLISKVLSVVGAISLVLYFCFFNKFNKTQM